ncbi:uncharacterized protein OCT59_003398 [Rhizophagus irregularis]|uniref:uncharacterized protein n=1 Tax=Rhizophagus irregularis TaxID=588596 RepID=UPI0033179BD5|nr:hypothetical protein OCT59_003398 [Rhizophagus irregularis]
MVFQYAKGGNFNHWVNGNYEYFNWRDKLTALLNIINGLKEIHQKNIVHRDFHTGNILLLNLTDVSSNWITISDMGLCGEVGNIDETKIYGVMPYVAPEVLRRMSYTQESDIYSFATHPQAIYTSKLLNPFTEDLPEYNDNSQCLDERI